MRLLLIMIILIPSILIAEDSAEPKLPRGAQRAVDSYESDMREAEQEYLETVKKLQDRLKDKLEYEVKRMRLNDDEETLVDKIVKTEDEKVKEALFTIASDDVKEAVNVRAKLSSLMNKGVATDFLGNIIKPEKEKKKELVIKSAKWGLPDGTMIDVTQNIKSKVKNNTLVFDVESGHETLGNPAPRIIKTLVVTYTVGGKESTVSWTQTQGVLKINTK